jgi:hypothetical protein
VSAAPVRLQPMAEGARSKAAAGRLLLGAAYEAPGAAAPPSPTAAQRCAATPGGAAGGGRSEIEDALRNVTAAKQFLKEEMQADELEARVSATRALRSSVALRCLGGTAPSG